MVVVAAILTIVIISAIMYSSGSFSTAAAVTPAATFVTINTALKGTAKS